MANQLRAGGLQPPALSLVTDIQYLIFTAGFFLGLNVWKVFSK
jgi:hypothetical protein